MGTHEGGGGRDVGLKVRVGCGCSREGGTLSVQGGEVSVELEMSARVS